MAKVKLIGAPFNIGSRSETSFAIDQHRAPAAIRRAYSEQMSGFNIAQNFDDLGDIACPNDFSQALTEIEGRIKELLLAGSVPLMLGGSHTVTLGSLRATKAARSDYSCVYLDAHPDIMPHPDINYGSSMYYALQEGLVQPNRLAFVGLRQVENQEEELMNSRSIMNFRPVEIERQGILKIAEQITEKLAPPFYISIDLDALDPAFAPGVTTPFPGGLTLREVLVLCQSLCAKGVIGADLVELCPANDRSEQTALLAAALLSSLASAI
ncbi:MAG: hypothetical protein DCC75_11140 [Proteobacteria bacterium]|nr:MAG: hypothetical protein DCC75_11140 [Pseudomonadota bacterium]